MASFLTLPFMAGLGILAIASPIIIHLLNRRRFKIVDWAAMEFLLNANKKNRKRIQLENIILLILRCIAMFLLGLLLARPFFPNDANLFGENQQFERIVVLDDSYSMNVREGNKTVFEIAKEKVKEFVRVLSKDKSSNTLTVYLASDMDQPAITNMDVTDETITELQDAIDELQCSDFAGRFDEGLASVEATVAKDSEKNRIFYLVTDLREKDWYSASQSEEGHPAQNLLKSISESAPLGCYVVDVGQEVKSEVNLAITKIVPDSALSSGVDCTFRVTVANFGDETVKNAVLLFYETENASPKSEIIETLEPGESKSVTKSFTVNYTLDDLEGFEDNDEIANQVGFWKVWAEVKVDDVSRDLVEVDSKRYYAAKVKRGVSVLLVDGDPSAIADRSETFFLRQAIRPDESNSGLIPTIVGVSELSSVDYSKYQVIYLCNVDELSEGQLESLEEWVGEGGSLVMMLGDQINEAIFNKQFYFDSAKAKRHAESKAASPRAKLQGGVGLSPVQLVGMVGDVNQEKWVNLDLGEARSQVTRFFEGQGNIAVSLVKFFSWWNSREEGFVPIVEPKSPILQIKHHYKFGPAHASSEEYSDEGSDDKVREFEVDSKAIEIGAEFVISDVLGNFTTKPIRLKATSGAKFSFGGKVSEELVIDKVPEAKDSEKHSYGCWRFKYSNGNVWSVTPELAENVADRGEDTNILARYNDESSNIAIAEKRFGKGRVVAFTFPADVEWTNLPQIGSANVLTHMYTCDYLAANVSEESSSVGDGVVETIDVSKVEKSAILTPPVGEKQSLKALTNEKNKGAKARFSDVTIPEMINSGFYVMTLTSLDKVDGEVVTEDRVYAANVDAQEGNLKRLDLNQVGKDYFGSNVKIINGPNMSSQTVEGARTEFWMVVLLALGGILILEQFLGWLFGRRR